MNKLLLIGTIVAVNALATSGCSSGDDDAATGGTGGMAPMAPACADIPSQNKGDVGFTVTVAGYASCQPIPAAHTCDGKPFPEGTSPAVSWTDGPAGTMSYAVVFKDLAVLARTAETSGDYNKGYHYAMWDIPATVKALPAAMTGGHLSVEVPGARQWSNFNDYAFFGPCPNYDPMNPTNFDDSYAFTVYALPTAKSVVPAPQMGISPVRLMDNAFKAAALAITEYRGTSSAHASEIPAGVLPPVAKPPCPTTGEKPEGCVEGP